MQFQFEIRFNGLMLGMVDAESADEAKLLAEQQLLSSCEFVNGIDEIQIEEDPDSETFVKTDEGDE